MIVTMLMLAVGSRDMFPVRHKGRSANGRPVLSQLYRQSVAAAVDIADLQVVGTCFMLSTKAGKPIADGIIAVAALLVILFGSIIKSQL